MECILPKLQPGKLVPSLPTLEGWKAELILVVCYIVR